MTTISSKIGRQPVTVPSGVEVKIENGSISAKGPKGQMSIPVHPYVEVKLNDGAVVIEQNKTEKELRITGSGKKTYRSIAGATRSNINNLITGVSVGFEKKLALVGVGYRAQAKGKVLSLSLGFSHPTDFPVPEGVTIETPTPTEILVKGSDKIVVGEVAANIRSIRPPEPYKGKGVRYADERIEIKETKKK